MATKGWIAGILNKGYDSMAIMQPLIDAMPLVPAQGDLNLKLSRRKASGSASSFSRCKIAEGLVSDSE